MAFWKTFRKNKQQPLERPIRYLADLLPGEHGIVASIHNHCADHERRRLMDLGFVPGTQVEAAVASPFNDPVAYRVKGALIALRRQQASLIHLTPY